MARSGGAKEPAGRSSAPAAEQPAWRRDDAPLRIGVSACLLGQPVRWDGGHKRDAFLSEQMAPFVEWVPVCPELELGMGVPRAPIRWVERAGERRLVAEPGGRDWTVAMRRFARRRVRELAALDLCGFVLKQGSPSCGVERVRVWRERGSARRSGRGAFAEALLAGVPALPVEEEARLADPRLRANWVERVFAFRRVRALFAGRWTRSELAAFHRAHELQLSSHAPRACAELGRLAASGPGLARAALRRRYLQGFMDALRPLATARRELQVLRRAQACLRPGLDAGERRELAALVEAFARGRVPLAAPIARVRQHAVRLGVAPLAGQVYLDPQPWEPMLRDRA